MSEEKELKDVTMISDILIRLTAIERVLINNNVISKEAFLKEVDGITKALAKEILKNANVPGDHDKILEDLENK